MGGNPLALVFLLLAVLLFGLTILFIVLQKRMFQGQANEVAKLLAEVRKMAAEEREEARRAAGDDAPDDR